MAAVTQRPVVQVRLDDERVAFLDSLPGSRSEAIRYCVDFTHGAHMTPGQMERRIKEATEPPARVAQTERPATEKSVEQVLRDLRR